MIQNDSVRAIMPYCMNLSAFFVYVHACVDVLAGTVPLPMAMNNLFLSKIFCQIFSVDCFYCFYHRCNKCLLRFFIFPMFSTVFNVFIFVNVYYKKVGKK